jgi:hypothetical protein
MIGMAIGDALGAHVEFRPHTYLEANPVKDLEGGGTWGLEKGQVFTFTNTNIYAIPRKKTQNLKTLEDFARLEHRILFCFPFS